VYKAVQVGDKRKARSLQKLILKSTSARFLAIRLVSQLNAGKKTAGIDGKKSLSFEERFNLEELLRMNSGNWKHQGLREIPIPKKDGTTRMCSQSVCIFCQKGFNIPTFVLNFSGLQLGGVRIPIQFPSALCLPGIEPRYV
jgi:hypothetical protein